MVGYVSKISGFRLWAPYPTFQALFVSLFVNTFLYEEMLSLIFVKMPSFLGVDFIVLEKRTQAIMWKL